MVLLAWCSGGSSGCCGGFSSSGCGGVGRNHNGGCGNYCDSIVVTDCGNVSSCVLAIVVVVCGCSSCSVDGCCNGCHGGGCRG